MILIQYYLLFETQLFINYTPAFFKAINFINFLVYAYNLIFGIF